MTNRLPRRSTLWSEESTSYADESCFHSGDVCKKKKKGKKKKKENCLFSKWDTRERENVFSYIYRTL